MPDNVEPQELLDGDVSISLLFGDITDPTLVGKDTAILVPGNTYFYPDLSYPMGVQAALVRKTSHDLLMAAREVIEDSFAMANTFKNGDMVVVDTDKVAGAEQWAENVPDHIIFGVTMVRDDERRHVVTAESISECIERILGSYDDLEISDSIAIPLLGTGMFGMDKEVSLRAIIAGIGKHISNGNNNLRKIKIVVYPDDTTHLLKGRTDLLAFGK